MSAILPPTDRLWWKHPMDKLELSWIFLVFCWGMIMFFMMIYWHINGKQNIATETYKTTPEKYLAKVDAFVQARTVRVEKFTDKETGAEKEVPVVKPNPGEDVYLVARLWDWYPILELEKDKQYKLHVTSIDYNHGFSLQPTNINIQIVPGYEHVNKVTPTASGTFGIICNEFCGIGHHKMVGRIYVK